MIASEGVRAKSLLLPDAGSGLAEFARALASVRAVTLLCDRRRRSVVMIDAVRLQDATRVEKLSRCLESRSEKKSPVSSLPDLTVEPRHPPRKSSLAGCND